jgi:tetrahydromethanopterin S-methyltransferase subunit E
MTKIERATMSSHMHPIALTLVLRTSVSLQGFLSTFTLVLITYLFVGMAVKNPHPLLVLLCLPVFPVLVGGLVLLLAWCT